MEEERIKAVKTWPEPQPVRDIQVFLGFANFYRKFIRNFSRIVATLTLMLRTTDESTGNEPQNTQAKNQAAPGVVGRAGSGGVGGSFENLSTAVKSAKSKKPKLTKSKNSDLAKANSGTDFLTPGVKEAFIYLRKAFTKAPILRHFDLECYI